MAKAKTRLLNEMTYAINKRNISTKEFCDSIDMALSSFYRKCSGVTEFTLAEIKRIIKSLMLSDEEINTIFFAD